MGTSRKYRGYPSATVSVVTTLLVVEAFALAVATVTIALAAASMVTTPVAAAPSHSPPLHRIRTVMAVLLVAVVKLPARIATGDPFSRTFSARRANGWVTWQNTVTCSPPRSVLKGT